MVLKLIYPLTCIKALGVEVPIHSFPAVRTRSEDQLKLPLSLNWILHVGRLGVGVNADNHVLYIVPVASTTSTHEIAVDISGIVLILTSPETSRFAVVLVTAGFIHTLLFIPLIPKTMPVTQPIAHDS